MLDDTTLKKAFALALMRPQADPYKIAFGMLPDNKDTGKAIQMASEWPSDPEVIEFQKLAADDPNAAGLLPTKFQAAQEILERARKERDNEVYVKLMQLYCNIMGQLEKPAAPANATPQTVINNRVISMPQPQTKELWTQQATQQQRALVLEGERLLHA